MASLTIPVRADHHPGLCGQVLDHYRIDNFAARGGMADIFRATDIRTGEPVAVKIPHAELEIHDVLMQSFAREGRILRKFDHPGIVRVTREPGHHRPYMVMEWLNGRLLRDILNEQGKLPAARAIRIARSICAALEHIHRRGVIHQDLKPENIMVDCDDRATIIDFGIAQTRVSRLLRLSARSRTMGTPDYISPEQVRGKRSDRRSDLYALGVILYEMLSGELPFSGLSPLVVMNARLLSDPPTVRSVNPAISSHLEGVIRRALESDPKKRYGSAREFASELSDQSQVVPPRRLRTSPQRGRRSAVRHVWLYLGLAMVPLLIFGLLLLEARREARSPSSSSLFRSSVVAQRESASRVGGFLEGSCGQPQFPGNLSS